jgi:hypothetical protein
MRFKSDKTDARARFYASMTRTNPPKLPSCLRGEVLTRALVISDFLRWRADDHEAALQPYVSLWPELLAICDKPDLPDDDDDELMGGTRELALSEMELALWPEAPRTIVVSAAETVAEAAEAFDDDSEETSLIWVEDQAVAEQLRLVDTLALDEGANLAAWLHQLRAQAKKPLRMATRAHAVELEKLITDYPNLAEAAEIVAGSVLLQAEKRRPVRLPRLLLDGQPGSGKTEFARTVAATMELPLISITLAAAHGAFELHGGHRGWRSAQPGRLFQGLLRSPVANPLYLFDEAERSKLDVQTALLAWLEDAKFRDQCLDLDFRCDQINSFLITNTVAGLDPAIQSRCGLVNVAPLTPDESRTVVRRIYARLIAREDFVDFNTSIDDALVERLLPLGLRHVRVTLESAFYRAALHGRRVLIEADLKLSSTASRGFGFLSSQ